MVIQAGVISTGPRRRAIWASLVIASASSRMMSLCAELPNTATVRERKLRADRAT